MIGVYDSGLGGLTVLAALRAAGIDDDAVYFADQAHVPYGERTDADLHGLLTANLAWLEAQGVDVVVMGCNYVVRGRGEARLARDEPSAYRCKT